MADLSPTATSVKPVLTGTNPTKYKAVMWGATVARGKPVYLDRNDNKWKLADGNVTAQVAGADGCGIAMSDGGDGQLGVVAYGGDVLIGATMVVGETYIQSAAVGMIAPIADVSTNFLTTFGFAYDANTLRMPKTGPTVTSVAHA